MKAFILQFLGYFLLGGLFLWFCFLGGLLPDETSNIHHYKFVVKEASFTRLCETKNILTVNGQFPGPTLRLRQGDTILVDVHNRAGENITIHWHGVKQPRYPWSDGPEFITQCPIRPGTKFTQKIILSDEIGTLWWHAHSDWSRATVHGLLIVHPKRGDDYPFSKPHAEIPLVLGEWWKSDIEEVRSEFMGRGGELDISDAFLVNGQPGDLYNCSKADTFKQVVGQGKTYLIRMVSAAMNDILFFGIAKHKVTVVGSDGAYTKPRESDYIAISPGQTIDFLLKANQRPDHYYMAAKAFSSNGPGQLDNTTTTAIIEYRGNYTPSSPPIFPNLPNYNNISASVNFTKSLRSLASKEHPIDVPKSKNMTKLFFTVSVKTLLCEANNTCEGPRGRRYSASLNNISLVNPKTDILQAYYYNKSNVYGDQFPSFPPQTFNFTADNISRALETPELGTEVKVLEYNSEVELVFQATNLVVANDHPMHLHGHSFYVVGSDLGNYNASKAKYNLVDPPLINTISVPKDGWTAIRFKANNPGVWFMHCHYDTHLSWGMGMTFIVKDGNRPEEKMLPPPPEGIPLC